MSHALRLLRVLSSLLCVLGVSAVTLSAPPVITSVTPDQHFWNEVPNPAFTITGSGFVVGLPSPTNRPTLTLTHQEGLGVFSTLGDVNFAGTQVTTSAANNNLNLLQAPTGVYDLTISRPDGESSTVVGAFRLQTEEAAAGDGVYLKQVGTWGGPVRDIDVAGDLAYIANGRALRILDISDPANPVSIGCLDLGGVSNVRVRDGYAFVSARSPYGFCVVDVADPAAPRLVWAEGSTIASGDSIELRGDIAYHRTGSSQIRAYTITDPLNVVSHGNSILLSPPVEAMHIEGDRLYTATTTTMTGQPSELRIHDLGVDPLSPPLLGAVSGPVDWGFSSIDSEGDTVVWSLKNRFGNNTWSYFVVNASNPAAPVIVYNNGGMQINPIGAVRVRNGFVYVAYESNESFVGPGGLHILDATNPASPAQAALHKTHASVSGARIIGERAYLFDEGEGLIILDVSDPAAPVRLGNYHSPSTLRRMERAGDLLYVSDEWHGFTVLDVSDRANPVVVGSYESQYWSGFRPNPFGIAVQGSRVYLAAGRLGLEVVDVGDPSLPAFLGAHRIPALIACHSRYAGVALSGNTAHIGFVEYPPCNTGGSVFSRFLNLNVSNPLAVASIGQTVVNNSGPLQTIVLNANGIAYCGRREPKATVNTSNPASPWMVLFNDVNPATDIALSGDTLFVVNGASSSNSTRGLYVQDVSDPADPVTLAHLNQNAPLNADGAVLRAAYAVGVQGDRLYTSAISEGGREVLHLFDVSDPASPALLARSSSQSGPAVSLPTASTTLVIDEPFVYCAAAQPVSSWTANVEGLAIYEARNRPSAGGLPGDANGDCVVDFNDITAILANWLAGYAPGAGPGDANSDGVVDFNDISAVLANYGSSCQ